MSLTPRPYQEEAVGRFVERIDKVDRGGLVVLPTGTGKSAVMAAAAQWWLEHRPGGVGIVSHRVELMRQNAAEFEALTGMTCYREQGLEHRVRPQDWDRIRTGGVVSLTVQTLQNRRLQKVSRDALGILLVDEAHRFKSSGQYVALADYFGCKMMGLTATPDRTDGQPLVPLIFDECWYDGRLDDFVEQGWLVPPKVQHVHVASLQWQWLKKRSGKDFTDKQVAAIWRDKQSIYQFVTPILKEVGDRKTLYFCPGVPQAHDVAAVINGMAHPRRAAEYVASYQIDADGNRSEYPKATRRRVLRDFGRLGSDLQHVANMGVFTEGTNVPTISAVGWLRVTKSRLLLAQGVGRAFRTWPGCLDGLGNATAAQRRAAIAASPKPFALIFDPTQITGRLKLVHVTDLFTRPDAPLEVKRRVAEILARKAKAGEPVDPREVLREAEELESPFFKGLRAALLEIAPQVDYRLTAADPFYGSSTRKAPDRPAAPPGAKAGGDASAKQKRLIEVLAPSPYDQAWYDSLGRKQAGAVIDKLLSQPCRPWILRKLPGRHPQTNKEGLAMLKERR